MLASAREPRLKQFGVFSSRFAVSTNEELPSPEDLAPEFQRLFALASRASNSRSESSIAEWRQQLARLVDVTKDGDPKIHTTLLYEYGNSFLIGLPTSDGLAQSIALLNEAHDATPENDPLASSVLAHLARADNLMYMFSGEGRALRSAISAAGISTLVIPAELGAELQIALSFAALLPDVESVLPGLDREAVVRASRRVSQLGQENGSALTSLGGATRAISHLASARAAFTAGLAHAAKDVREIQLAHIAQSITEQIEAAIAARSHPLEWTLPHSLLLITSCTEVVARLARLQTVAERDSAASVVSWLRSIPTTSSGGSELDVLTGASLFVLGGALDDSSPIAGATRELRDAVGPLLELISQEAEDLRVARNLPEVHAYSRTLNDELGRVVTSLLEWGSG
jgi:hypothetical protein